MWTVSWFCEQFGESFIRDIEKEATSVEDYFNQKAEKVPAGSEGLITIHDWALPLKHNIVKVSCLVLMVGIRSFIYTVLFLKVLHLP